MFDSLISAMSSNYATFLGSMVDPRPMGTSFPTIVPYRCYAAADRSLAIAVGSERLWQVFCEVIGRSDLSRHPDYQTNARRVENRQHLDAILEETFRQHQAAVWIERLNAAGIPCALVRTFTEVLHDPQSAVRDMFPTLDHPRARHHRVTGAPVKFSLSPGRHRLAAPLLGQQTRRVLKDLLHLEDPQLELLFTSGVLHETTAE
jgi:CoA:oxalate CoA-transferase